MDPTQRVALITGGASGLGAASARMIVEAGGSVVLVDVDSEKGQALSAELGEAAEHVAADVRNPEQVEAAIRTARERFGRLDVAINCHGIGGCKRVLSKAGPHELEWFTNIIEVNLVGTFNVIRLAAAAMAQNDAGPDGERGVLINTTSIAAYEGQSGQAAYVASKGGIATMTLPIARDLAPHGIRVIAIAPGLFDTPMVASVPQEAQDVLREVRKSVPFPQRMGRPEEFARLVRHIIDNPYLNGDVIRLDAALRIPPNGAIEDFFRVSEEDEGAPRPVA